MRMHWTGWLLLAAAPALLAQPATQQNGEPTRETHVYDVSFLTRAVPQYEAEIWPRAGDLELGADIYEDFARGPISFSDETDEDEAFVPTGVAVSAESLRDVIVQNIAEDSWANQRNLIAIDGESLVIVQTAAVHERIAQFLAAIRARRAHMVAVEIAVVPTSALAEEHIASPWITGESFAKAVTAAGPRAHSIALTAYNTQTTSGFSGRVRTTSTDTEINQTGVLPVANSVIEPLPIGTSLEVRPQAITGTDWFRVDLRVAHLAEAGEVRERKTLFSDLEFVPLSEESLQTVLLLRETRPAVVATFRDRRPDGTDREFAVLARLSSVAIAAESAESPAVEPFHLRLYDLSFLLEPFEGERGRLSVEAWASRIESTVDPTAWRDERASVAFSDEGILEVTARASTHRAVRDWIDARVRDRARIATVEISEYTGPTVAVLALVAAADDGIYLAEDWLEAPPGRQLERRFHAVTRGAVGGRARVRGLDARSYVAGIECVSGGTGFSIIEMPDPVVVSAGTGFELEVTVEPRLDAETMTLTLDWARRRTTFDSSIEFRPNVQIAAVTSAVDPRALPSRNVRVPFVIDLPRQSSNVFRGSVPLRTGRLAILEVEKQAGAAASLLVARVTTHEAMAEGGER